MLDEIASAAASNLQTMDAPFSQIPEGLGAWAIMGKRGDTKYIWDPSKPVEVEAARLLFDTLKRKNYLAFKVKGEKGDKDDEEVKEFDPTLGRLIFSPQMGGG